ncbi:MAG: hypothetical protein QF926_03270 [Alphaproteobacteria bacterium]|jgi:hypothetical protein|nr:hypothetical protein [Alphaproteobacteria bacterium]
MKPRWIASACVVAMLGGAPVAVAGNLVVLDSDMFGLQAGDVVDGTQQLEIPDGKRLTLISENGEVLELDGPYSGVPDAGSEEGGGLVAALSDLILSEGTDDSSLGAVRASVADNVKDPWLIDITRDGDHCVTAEGTVTMWRRSPDLFSAIRVSDGEKAAKTAWPEEAATLAWPPPIEKTDGATYRITLDETQNVSIVLHVVPTEVDGDPRRAAWMAKRGCRQQALLLLASSLR